MAILLSGGSRMSNRAIVKTCHWVRSIDLYRIHVRQETEGNPGLIRRVVDRLPGEALDSAAGLLCIVALAWALIEVAK